MYKNMENFKNYVYGFMVYLMFLFKIQNIYIFFLFIIYVWSFFIVFFLINYKFCIYIIGYKLYYYVQGIIEFCMILMVINKKRKIVSVLYGNKLKKEDCQCVMS